MLAAIVCVYYYITLLTVLSCKLFPAVITLQTFVQMMDTLYKPFYIILTFESFQTIFALHALLLSPSILSLSQHGTNIIRVVDYKYGVKSY